MSYRLDPVLCLLLAIQTALFLLSEYLAEQRGPVNHLAGVVLGPTSDTSAARKGALVLSSLMAIAFPLLGGVVDYAFSTTARGRPTLTLSFVPRSVVPEAPASPAEPRPGAAQVALDTAERAELERLRFVVPRLARELDYSRDSQQHYKRALESCREGEAEPNR